MASVLRCLVRTNLFRKPLEAVVAPCAAAAQAQAKRYCTSISPLISDLNLSELPDFEVSKDPAEWQYVERLLPLKIVPQPKIIEGPAPSGWVPQKPEGKTHPYFIKRTKNHMEPVYLKLSYRGTRQITLIRYIQGNIWQLEKDLRKFLESKIKSNHIILATRVNEMSGQIRIRGDYVSYVKLWMNMKGF